MQDLSLNTPLSMAGGFPDSDQATGCLGFGRFVNSHSRQIEGRLRYGNDESMLLFGPPAKARGRAF